MKSMISESWRFEKKFVLQNMTEEKTLNEILLHPALFVKEFESRAINNLYLDSAELSFFYDHISGSAKRIKARIRWYGDFEKLDKPQLEIKFRDADIGAKKCIPLSFDRLPYTQQQLSEVFRRNTKLLASIFESTMFLKPILLNQYRRDYWKSLCGRIRLTVDREIHYRRVYEKIWLSEKSDLRVLELKYSAADAVLGQSVLQNFSVAAERSSKYVRGLLKTQIT